MSAFRNLDYLEPAQVKNRYKARVVDLLIIVGITLIIISIDQFNAFHKILIIGGYLFVLQPVFMIIGATPGQISANLRIRKYRAFNKNISLLDAYKRILFLVVSAFTNILYINIKRKFLYDKLSDTILVELNYEKAKEELEELKSRNSIINFIIVAVIYTTWVIWLDNYWFLLGLVVIFDMYITKKVNWSPWKRRDGKNSTVVEWIDALIFAVIAVTIINIFLFQNYKIPTGSMEKTLMVGDHLFVSKTVYGPRIPNTPLAFPFAQHTMPVIKTKSYLEWIKLPYKRLKGFKKINRDDIVVFNFPAGDTVVLAQQNVSYYSIVRDVAFNPYNGLKTMDIRGGRALKTDKEYYKMARRHVWDNYDIVIRPVDRQDNYIKRCVAVPGDSLQIIEGKVFVNRYPQPDFKGIQYNCRIFTGGKRLNPRVFEKLQLFDIKWNLDYKCYEGALTSSDIENLQKIPSVVDIQRNQPFVYKYSIFPFDNSYNWDLDNFGPVYIPKKGDVLKLTPENIPFYIRMIDQYEHNDIEMNDSSIIINGVETDKYTVKMNYYWMMGDNRHSSLDSRYWGYVPEDHIIGSPKFIWLSLNKYKKFPANIRLRRMFKGV